MNESFAWLGDVTLAQAAVTLTAMVSVYLAGRKVVPWVRDVVYFLDDITGRKARHGQQAQPGLLERQGRVEGTLARQDETLREMTATLKELKPNGGGSIKDQITGVVESITSQASLVHEVAVQTAALKTSHEAHLIQAAASEVDMRTEIRELRGKAEKA